MANQPFYHLRPNKCIDRNLFCQTLQGLSRLFNISDYSYTGFGSYQFDDFKLLHELLNITKMTSLESEKLEFDRAVYNKPYSCIEVLHIKSSEYISELEIDEASNSIFWLDYVSPGELGAQLADYASLLNLLNPHDIVRITLNANPDSLGKNNQPDRVQQMRLETLKSRVEERYLPTDIGPDSVTKQNYPFTLLRIIKAVTMECLEDRPPYSPNFLLPLFATVYADGQQMLTFTGIVLDSHDSEAEIRNVLSEYRHNSLSWDQITRIEIPPLSTKEMIEINKLLPSINAQQQLKDMFPFIFTEKDTNGIESYISFYKYYPNYHHVSF